MPNFVYYSLKPFIPRRVQIWLRRKIVQRKLKRYSHIWPIDEQVGKPPAGWPGWPEGKKFALILTHDVESAKGISRCLQLAELEEKLGFRSSFNFVAEDYEIPETLFENLRSRGFEIGLHGLTHNGNPFRSKKYFRKNVDRINRYLKEWGAKGFRAPSMYHNLELVGELNIEYDSSTFDTDPFEPQPDGVGTIFPFLVRRPNPINQIDQIDQKDQIDQINQIDQIDHNYFVELPYTLPQDHLLFILLQEKGISIWKKKLDWIAEKGGMALLGVHPDYIDFSETNTSSGYYPAIYYENFLKYIKNKYEKKYWNTLPKDLSEFCRVNIYELEQRRPHKLRVCMLGYTFLEYDGRVKRYAEALEERGDEVEVICLKRNGTAKYENPMNFKIYRIQDRSHNERRPRDYFVNYLKFFLRASLFLGKRNLKNSYHLIHVHNIPDFLVFCAIVPKIMGSKVILDIHDILPELYANKFEKGPNSFLFKLFKLIEKLSAKFSDHVIVSNHIWAEKIILRSTDRERVSVFLNYPNEKIFCRNSKNNNPGEFKVIYPGTLNWHQGLDIAIKAISLIKNELPDLKFYIYGDGPEKSNLMKLINELQLKEMVFFRDSMPLEKIAEIMAEATVGIVPKRNDNFGGEAFSTKIFEFMALGVPVILARTKIDDFYFNEEIVKFFEPEDEKDLAKCILELAHNEERRRMLSANALEFVKNYRWGKKKQEYLDLVDSLVYRK